MSANKLKLELLHSLTVPPVAEAKKPQHSVASGPNIDIICGLEEIWMIGYYIEGLVRRFTLTVFQGSTYGFKSQMDLDGFGDTVTSGGRCCG